MKSKYEFYLKLENIRQKIGKIEEPNCKNTSMPLSSLWRQLPYLNQDSNETLKQHELILNSINRLRPKDGIVAISPGFKCNFFCSFLIDSYKYHRRPAAINGGYYDIIYAYKHGIVALAYSDDQNVHGHDGLADKMHIVSGDERDSYIVGGGILFDGQKFITSELSGHYGHLWTNELRQKICDLISNATGYEVEHRVWGKTIAFSSIQPEKKIDIAPYSIGTLGFFSTQTRKHTNTQKDELSSRCVML